MNCPNCGNDNPTGARFCMTCGQALAQPCANCGTLLPPSAAFCFNCGQPRGESPAPPSSIKPSDGGTESLLQRFIPSELVGKLEAAPGEGERRIVTMLFCDVKGSTAAAGNLDPEEWVEIINGAFEGMIRPVYQYEGMVARLMGDGILAFFGAPVAHEDDPQRAILAGLGILDSIRAYREGVARRWGVDIDVRVGINTGMVVVGSIGTDLRLEYTAIGDAINLAARMEQTAEPGTVQVAEETYRLAAPLFDFEDLGELSIKGKDKPVRAWRALGRKVRPGRLRGIAGLESPLVGRDREFAALRERLESLSRGTGGIVFFLGEAGLGKSRLIGEGRLMEALTPTYNWFETVSLSYETAQPYGLFQRLFRRLFGLTAADDPMLLKEKLAAELADVYGDAGDVPGELYATALDVLERMLVGDAATERPHLEGELFSARLQRVMADLWRQRSMNTPTILVFDDLHWSDVASVDLLGRLFELAGERPILFLCAMRPDKQTPAWATYERAGLDHAERLRAIALSPLSVAESGDLARGLFRQIDWPPQLQRRVLEKAGGNPFFVEELVRALLESGVIMQDGAGRWVVDRTAADVDLPDTLQGLLLARIDRLQEEARRTLQLASVIGRSFYFQVLVALADVRSGLERDVIDLLAADLIREAAQLPELEYMFTHALTQEAAYSSILLKRRREFHRRVGEVLESLFPQRLEEMAPVLAQHYDRARDWDRAVSYYTLAGDVAFSLYANAEAAIHYRRALDILLEAEESDSRTVAHLFSRLGRALELLARYSEALELYDRMEAWATKVNDRGMLLASLLGRSTIRTTANAYNDPAEALRLLERAKTLSAEVADRETEARILWNLMLLTSLNRASFPEHQSYVERALAVAREAGLREQEAFILFDSWYYYGAAGEWQTGLKNLLEALNIWRDLGNMPLLSETYARLKYVNWFLGEYDRALAYSEEGFRLAKLSNNIEAQAINLSGMGVIYIDRGELQRGLDVMEEAVALGHQAEVVTAVGGTQAQLGWTYGWVGKSAEESIEPVMNAATWLEERMAQVAGFALAPLSRLYLLVGDIERAEQTLGKLISFQEQKRRMGFVASIWVETGLAEVELAMRAGRPDEALAMAETLRAIMERDGVRYKLADVMLFAADCLQQIGRADEATFMLDAAENTARSIGSRRILWEILALKGDLARASGDQDAAEGYYQASRQIVEEMAGTLLSPELRASFRRRTAARLPELSLKHSHDPGQEV